MPKINYSNDEWTLTDGFGMGRAGDQLARIALTAQPPFAIGVTGKWGSGKTSVMRRGYFTLGGHPLEQPLAFAEPSTEYIDNEQLKFDAEQRDLALDWDDDLIKLAKASCCVWFSPWQHQNETNPLIPLLLEIQAQFSAWQRTIKKISENKRRILLSTSTLLERLIDAGCSLTAGKNIKVASGTTEAVKKAWTEASPYLTEASDGQRFHLLFEDAIKTLLQAQGDGRISDNARMIIFIDDLDRCEEEVIVTLLEAIKLYLNSRHCVFVLGIDDTAVVDALSRCWQRGDDLNREYLEKLFQARISVPLPQPAHIESSVNHWLIDHGIESVYTEVMARDIEALLEPNPRKVKNFVNSLAASWGMLNAKVWVLNETEARCFVVVHYLQQYHRPIWRLIERQPTIFVVLCRLFTQGKNEMDNGDFQSLGLDPDAQDVLIEMIIRHFSHVMASGEGEDDKHGREDLNQAVDKFLQRQDRKRSDERLGRMISEIYKNDIRLNEHYLYICQASVIDNSNKPS